MPYQGVSHARPVGLTGCGATPIMQRSFENLRERVTHVVYVSTAIEPQKEARTRLPQTHEHKKRPESLGPSSSQGPGAFDGLAIRPARTSAPVVFLKQGRFSRASRSGPAEIGTQESRGGSCAGLNEPDDVGRCRRSVLLSSSQPRHRIREAAWPAAIHGLF